jgi:hypothetical protein
VAPIKASALSRHVVSLDPETLRIQDRLFNFDRLDTVEKDVILIALVPIKPAAIHISSVANVHTRPSELRTALC